MAKRLARQQRRDEAELREMLLTDAGMARFLDRVVGVGAWVYDDHEDVWIVPEPQPAGAGRQFRIVKRGGDWFTATLPDATT